MKILLVFFALLLVGCSSAPQPDRWQRQSAVAFESYKHHLLKGDVLMAKYELATAKRYAAQGADFKRMAAIALGSCTLETILHADTSACKEYEELRSVTTSPKLKSYNALVRKEWGRLKIDALPKRYRAFAAAMKEKDYKAANKTLQQQTNPETMLVEFYLLGKNATQASQNALLKQARKYGYKEAVLYVLHVRLAQEVSKEAKKRVKKEIAILKKAGEHR